MDRIPRADELTAEEMISLRIVVASGFTPGGQISRSRQNRLLELELIQRAMGGLMPTPAGRIVARR